VLGTVVLDGIESVNPDGTGRDSLSAQFLRDLYESWSRVSWVTHNAYLTNNGNGDGDIGKGFTANKGGGDTTPWKPVTRLIVKTGRKVVLLKLDDIGWIRAARNYVTLHVGARSHRVRGTLDSIQVRLPPDKFVRISRSNIVQVDRIKELELFVSGDCRVMLRDGTKLNLSRRYRANFRKLGLL
jgi:hypothetical protein